MLDRLGAHPVPVQLPIGAEADFDGIIDLDRDEGDHLQGRARHGVRRRRHPARHAEPPRTAREHLLEEVSHYDDELRRAHPRGGRDPRRPLKAAIRKATLDIKLTPVFCGSAFKNKGVQPLLDAVLDYLPRPLDVPPVTGCRSAGRTDGEPAERPADDSEPFAALAFKIMADPFVGKLTYFRVYSGQLEAGSRVLNVSTGRTERVGRILMMHANDREELPEVYAGDIAAASASSRSSPATRWPPPTRRSSSRRSCSPSR
jgi:elongation factor G